MNESMNDHRETMTSRNRYGLMLLLMALMGAALLGAAPLQAQEEARRVPLGELLNPDGTLKKGMASSAIDPSGWMLASRPGAAPRFVPEKSSAGASLLSSVPDDARWDDRFGDFIMDGDIYSMAVIGDDIYVGGSFTRLNEVKARHIARWNGAFWAPLGDGVDGPVYAIGIEGDRLYAGGEFHHAGGVGAENLAQWNPSTGQWSPIGGATSSGYAVVSVIRVDSNYTYFGGSFETIGGIAANNIARRTRDGVWSALGTGAANGVDGDVLAIATRGRDVYVGGAFLHAGTVASRSITRWNDDTKSWNPLGGGVYGSVNAIAVDAKNVYAGGAFGLKGSADTINIATWNGSAWTPYAGLWVEAQVRYIELTDFEVYMTGTFRGYLAYSTGGAPPPRYPGFWGVLHGGKVDNYFQPLPLNYSQSPNYTPPGFDGYSNVMVRSGNSIYVGGVFHTVDKRIRARMARWDIPTQRWFPFGAGVVGPVTAMTIHGNEVYVAGGYDRASATGRSTIVKWDGTRWTLVVEGIANIVNAMAFSGDDLYVGGQFSMVGTVRAKNVARWNSLSDTWFPLDSGAYSVIKGITPIVYGLAAYGNDLYVGGQIDQVGRSRQTVSGIARWDMAKGEWHSMDAGVDGAVLAIAVNPSGVPYIGGTFSGIDTTSSGRIARWDGAHWKDVGLGANDQVNAVTFKGNDLYIGGFFTAVGGDSIGYLARWDGAAWHGLGAGVGGKNILPYINSIAFGGDDIIYAAGHFMLAGGDSATNIARWDGRRWAPLGSGTDDEIVSIGITTGGLYASGKFGLAGLKPSYYFGRWDLAPLSVERAPTATAAISLRGPSPNPFTGSTVIRFDLPSACDVTIRVFDMEGREVGIATSGRFEEGSHEVTWNAGDLPAGAYCCRLQRGGSVESRMLLLIR
ncbi:MAG: hypothetical protein JWQ98_1834 [Chlorobi bacterium]|nr:hypothetical protein [Chlorobiota bacterium]